MTRDDAAQMLTLEATMAALILIAAALFLTQFATPDQVDRGDDYSRVELQRYGQDMMRLVTTKSIKPSTGYELQLFREWNSTEDDGVKWRWDENGTQAGNGTAIDEDQMVYTTGVDTTWTDDHLMINDSASENQTVWFTVKPRGGFVQKPSERGTLYRIIPFKPSSKIETKTGGSFDFPTSLYDGSQTLDGDTRTYGASMVWLQNESQGITPPVLVWQNATPDQHDGIVSINETATTDGTIEPYWHLVRMQNRGSVFVDFSENKFRVLGPGLPDKGLKPGETQANVSIVDHGSINSTHDQYEIVFHDGAIGGYSAHATTGASDKWSDPVFINVGELATVDRQISPFDNILNPVQPDYFDDEFVPYLDEVVPRNMEYRFVVYEMDGSGREKVVTSAEGVQLAKHEDRIPVDPVVVNRFVTTSNGSRTDVYNARLWLWYR